MGYVEGENVTFIVQNAQADMGLCQQIAQQMAQECDLVCAIATPMAQAAFNACMDSGKPVIYTAVSDPVAAMLANDEGKSEYNVTGTCDVLPVEAQLEAHPLLPAGGQEDRHSLHHQRDQLPRASWQALSGSGGHLRL